MNVESKLKILFFQNSSPEEIYQIIKEYSEQPKSEFISFIDCLMNSNIDFSKKEKAIQALEELFLLKRFSFLRKNLFILYDSIENEPMARYFLNACQEDDPDSLYDVKEIVKKYNNNLIEKVKFSYYKNNFSNKYLYNEFEKTYSIFSFSNEIGNNMTLVKTPYGALVFDCGAKCSLDGTVKITKSDIEDFLFATDTKISDIKGCFISHAHLDHYGSINSIIDAGLPKNKLFIGKETRELILAASYEENFKINDSLLPENFFVANNSIRITPINNGHILGSQSFLISFDNINIFYTGDYCIHDQLTVDGLSVKDILSIESVRQNGIDCLITETTYGHSIHYLDHDSSIYALIHFTDILLNLNYKIFFPSFAIGRSQEIASMLNRNYSILLDGLSVRISQLYEKLSDNKIFNENTRYNVEEDKMYNFDMNNIVIASSGMLTEGSTSYNYMVNLLKNNDNVAIFKTGFISSESAGNELLNQWKNKNKIFIETPLSAHASYDEIIELIDKINPKNVVSIHGDGLLFHDVSDAVLYDVNIEKNDVFSNIHNKDSEKSNLDLSMNIIDSSIDKIDENAGTIIKNKYNITNEDFLDAKNRIDNLYSTHDRCNYNKFVKALEGNNSLIDSSFKYIHKSEETINRPKGLYAKIPALNYDGYSFHTANVLKEIRQIIEDRCRDNKTNKNYNLVVENKDDDNKISKEKPLTKKGLISIFASEIKQYCTILMDAAIIDAKRRIDLFNGKTNYSKSIRELIKYMDNNPLFEGVEYKYVTKREQSIDLSRGMHVNIPALNLHLYNEKGPFVINEILQNINNLYNSLKLKNNKTKNKEVKNSLEICSNNNIIEQEMSFKKDDISSNKTKIIGNNYNDIGNEGKFFINDPFIKSKIDNAVKLGISLKENNISLDKSHSFISAIKLFLKFLKMHNEYNEINDVFVSLQNDYETIFDIISFIKEHDYCFYK